MTDELRMNAYYYSFEPTGVREIDVILSAVARAGKSYHHTEAWSGGYWDDKPEYPEAPFEGDNWIDRIQNAANAAATRAEAAERLNGELTNALRLIAHGDFDWAVDDAAAWAQRTLNLTRIESASASKGNADA